MVSIAVAADLLYPIIGWLPMQLEKAKTMKSKKMKE